MQHPMDDEQLQLCLHIVAGLQSLRFRTGMGDDNVPEIPGQVWHSDEGSTLLLAILVREGLVGKGQYIGRRINTPVLKVEFVQLGITGYQDTQLARPLYSLVTQGRQRSLVQNVRSNMCPERLTNLDLYGMGGQVRARACSH
jgi:hypothetical protein